MFRTTLALLATVALAGSARAACEIASWNPRWFDADAVHYTAGDLDGDAVPEIISASDTTVSWRRPPQFAAFPVYTSTLIGAPAAADVTGDGKTDLVIPNDGNDTLVVLPGNGNGTFGSAVVTPLPVSPVRFLLGNFSGGAHTDVALIGSGAALIFLQGDGTGAFTQAGNVAILVGPRDLAKANFDGDGYDDVAVSNAGSDTVQVVFANGSGGAAATVPVDGGASALLGTADFDLDGDADLYVVRIAERRLDVLPNTGSRTFGFALSYNHLWNELSPPPHSMALADFDGDTNADLALGHPGFIRLQMRTSNSPYGYPWIEGSWINLNRPVVPDNARSIAAADFTGDGRADLAVENAAAGHGGLIVNECGRVLATVWVQPVTSAGQAARVSVAAAAPHGRPVPTGTARLSWSGGEKTVTLFAGRFAASAQTTIDGLPLGFQPVVVAYSGDANYPAATSTEWTTVTAATTTTAISGPTRWTYGERPTFNAVVTSSTGETPAGEITFLWRGVALAQSAPAPAAQAPALYFPAGTHTVSAEFWSMIHPPSSASMEVTVDKSTSTLRLLYGTMSRAGQPAEITAVLRARPQWVMTGTVRLMDGATTLATHTLNSQIAFEQAPTFTVQGGLAPGTHTLRVVWDGDGNVNGSSAEFQHTVHPADAPLLLRATAAPAYVTLEFLRVAPGVDHAVYKRVASGEWTRLGIGGSPFYDPNVTPGTTYEYQIRATVDGTEVMSNIATVSVGHSRRRTVRHH